MDFDLSCRTGSDGFSGSLTGTGTVVTGSGAITLVKNRLRIAIIATMSAKTSTMASAT